MGLQIEKSFVVNAPFPAVWEFLTDPYKVASCLPGAAITEKVDDQSYTGTMTVKVGPVTANYRGKMRFERLDRDAGEADIAASGQETRGKGGADMRMKSRVVERASGETEVTVTSDVNVAGVLAQLGRGMIQDVSDQLFQKFSNSMRRELETPTASAPAPVEKTPSSQAAPKVSETSSVAATPPASAPPPSAEALDLGALGAAAVGRAVGRTLRSPEFWIGAAAFAVISWLLRRFRR